MATALEHDAADVLDPAPPALARSTVDVRSDLEARPARAGWPRQLAGAGALGAFAALHAGAGAALLGAGAHLGLVVGAATAAAISAAVALVVLVGAVRDGAHAAAAAWDRGDLTLDDLVAKVAWPLVIAACAFAAGTAYGAGL